MRHGAVRAVFGGRRRAGRSRSSRVPVCGTRPIRPSSSAMEAARGRWSSNRIMSGRRVWERSPPRYSATPAVTAKRIAAVQQTARCRARRPVAGRAEAGNVSRRSSRTNRGCAAIPDEGVNREPAGTVAEGWLAREVARGAPPGTEKDADAEKRRAVGGASFITGERRVAC